MKKNNKDIINRPEDFARGVTLVEIMIALLILALAALPIIGTFFNYYGVATKQMDQEIALKIGEAAINKLLSHKYSDMVSGTAFTVPLNFQASSGSFAGTLAFDASGKATAAVPVKIGKATYAVSAEIKKVFLAQNLLTKHNNAMVFHYAVEPLPVGGAAAPPAVAPAVATYSCFDDLLSIQLSVNYGGPKNRVDLVTFRADMTK